MEEIFQKFLGHWTCFSCQIAHSIEHIKANFKIVGLVWIGWHNRCNCRCQQIENVTSALV